MYNRLLTLYQEGRLTEQMLSNAVKKGWITEEQKQQIIESVA
jgi:hypothetical protein